MQPKPPDIERKLIIARDHRRKYGARLTFQVLRREYLGGLTDFTFLLPNGAVATLRKGKTLSWESGFRYELELEAYPTAALAEEAGMQAAQGLLLAATSLGFGIRLNYHSHEPPTVFDRTVSAGDSLEMEGFSNWPQDVVVQELSNSFTHRVRNRRLLLSMELFAGASLESNDRAKFVMAVSALEPLAEQHSLGAEVSEFVDRAAALLDADSAVPAELRQSLRGRVLQLRKESVRQALHRLCATWFPGNKAAREEIDFLYSLRSEILHEGRVSDLDVLLSEQTGRVSGYLRQIYAREFNVSLRMPASA